MPDADTDLHRTLAVIGHGLLNSMATVVGVLELLAERGDELSPDDRDQLVRRARTQARYVADLVQDFVRGLPMGTWGELDESPKEPGPGGAPRP